MDEKTANENFQLFINDDCFSEGAVQEFHEVDEEPDVVQVFEINKEPDVIPLSAVLKNDCFLTDQVNEEPDVNQVQGTSRSIFRNYYQPSLPLEVNKGPDVEQAQDILSYLAAVNE